MKQFIASILILLILPATTFSQMKGMHGIAGGGAISIKDKAGNQVGLYKESHALVIGVSDYTAGWPDLEAIPSEIDQLVNALEAQNEL
jgi:hypothetical protein